MAQDDPQDNVTQELEAPPPGNGLKGHHSGQRWNQETAQANTDRRLLGGIRNRLQTARTLLAKPAPSPSETAVIPVEALDERLPPHDINLEVAKWTRRRDIPLAVLGWSGVVLLVLWLASHVVSTILLLVIAILLAYALAPLVRQLERVMPRLLAILLVYLVFLTGISILLYFIVRTAVDQVSSLAHYLGNMVTPGRPGQATPLEQFLGQFGISTAQIASARNQLINQLEGLAGSVVPVLTGVANAALDVILVIILSIYLLFDGSRAVTWFRRDMPRRQRGRVRFLLNTMQRVVGGYIRGQLFLCTLIGVLVGVGMGIIGVPYALLLGVLAFVLEFIPVLGTLLSGAICVLFALTRGPFIALIVLAYFIGVHIIEGDVVGPRIVGKAVGLHPVVSIVALIAGAELFGVWGALFASPIAGVLQSLLVAIWSEWREAHPEEFQGAKQRVEQSIERNIADKPVNPDPPEKLLS